VPVDRVVSAVADHPYRLGDGDAPVDDLVVSINDDDLIEGTTASGQVLSGTDAYRFAGEITNHQTTGNTDLYENGELLNGGNGGGGEQHLVLVGPGSDEGTQYYVTVDGSIEKSDTAGDAPIDDKLVSINVDDYLYGRLAQGVLYEGADACDIEGDILDIGVDGPVTAYLDGEQVNPENLGVGPVARFSPTSEEITVSPGQTIHFPVTVPYFEDLALVELYVDGEKVDDTVSIESIAWPVPITSMRWWNTDSPETYQVEAVPKDASDITARSKSSSYSLPAGSVKRVLRSSESCVPPGGPRRSYG